LDKLDRQFAGKFGRNLAVTYLNKRAVPMLYRPCSDTVRRELFHSVSVLCEVIGYMAYDAQLHGIAQRYLIQSLRLAREAENVAYGSFVLATLSHQALYVGQPNHALTLAQGAEHNYRNGPISTVTTEAAMLQATAYSSIGDRSNCERSLSQAEALFDRQRGDTLPYWASHWGDAVFASFVGECWIKLEQPRKAQPYLDLAWKESGGQVRRRVFAAGQLAKAAALEGDIERSIEYGTIALDAARIAGSKRSHRVVQEVIETLSRYSSVKTVQEFTGHVSVTLS
jgi:hypothetical protein